MTDVSPEERRFYASVDTGCALGTAALTPSPRACAARRPGVGHYLVGLLTQASSLDGRQSKALIEINRGPADLEIIGGARILPPSGALEKIHGIAIKRLS